MKRETIFICSCLKISRQCPLKILSQKMQGKSKNTHPLILKSPYHFTIHIPISKIPAKVDISSQDYIYIFFEKKLSLVTFQYQYACRKRNHWTQETLGRFGWYLWCWGILLLIPELGKVFEMNFEYKNINHNCILLLIGG